MSNPYRFIANKLTIEINTISDEITSAYIAVGKITESTFAFGHRKLEKCKNVTILCGVHMATSPDVMRQLQKLTFEGVIKSGVYTQSFFHAKLYLFQLKSAWIAFVGSGNFTQGGWQSNEELFIKVTDQQVCQELIKKFNTWENICKPIDKRFIEIYEQSFSTSDRLEKEKKKNIEDMLDQINSKFNINHIKFNGQFFKKEDVLAFEPKKTYLDTREVLDERQGVRNKLYKLNDLLAPRIPRSLNIVPHYDVDHIASHIETKNHHDFRVRSLWVGYGRTKKMLKMYDKYQDMDTTPLHFMRMQAIISYDKFGVWLMPGKNNAGQIDRENLLTKIKQERFNTEFFNLVSKLGEPYWIDVAEEIQSVTRFKTSNELREFVEKDNWRYYYFIIGRDYNLDDKAISEGNIIDTCLKDFSRYWPIYDLIRDKTFDK